MRSPLRFVALSSLLLIGPLACLTSRPNDLPAGGPGGASPAGTGGAQGVSSGGAGGGGSGGTGGTTGGTSASLEPLSPRTFVFSRSFPRTKNTDGFAESLQFFAFDVESRTERLVSKLDDDGTNPNVPVSGPSLSPDLKWIAFGSQTFRFAPMPGKPGLKSGALWRVSVDGRQFERLTPPFAESHVWSSLDVRYNSPTWSPDGSTVFFQDWRFHTCPPSGTEVRQCKTGGGLRAVTAARITEWKNQTCYDDYPVSVKPDGTAVLVVAHDCTAPGSGVHEIPTDPTRSNQRTNLVPKQSSYDSIVSGRTIGTNLSISSAEWLSDGSGILMAGTGNTKKSTGSGFRTALFRWSPPDKIEQIYEHSDDASDITSAKISPAGEVIVRIVNAAGGGNVYLLDPANRTLGAQLTTSSDVRGIDW